MLSIIIISLKCNLIDNINDHLTQTSCLLCKQTTILCCIACIHSYSAKSHLSLYIINWYISLSQCATGMNQIIWLWSSIIVSIWTKSISESTPLKFQWINNKIEFNKVKKSTSIFITTNHLSLIGLKKKEINCNYLLTIYKKLKKILYPISWMKIYSV